MKITPDLVRIKAATLALRAAHNLATSGTRSEATKAESVRGAGRAGGPGTVGNADSRGRVAKIATALEGRLAGYLWFTPWQLPEPDKVRARQEEWLRATTSFRVRSAGRTLHGFTAGRGPTVVLVHGWGDRGARMGAFVAPLVAAGYRAVGFDLPAHGASGGGQTDALEIARSLRDVIEHFDGAHAVIAHSIGAHSATVALAQGLEVDGVVLLSPSVRLSHALGPFIAMFGLPNSSESSLRRRIERRFGASVWEDFAADVLARDIAVPALIIHDTDDPQVAVDDGRLLAQAWPGAQLKLTNGLGHNRIARAPEVIDAAVGFLRGLSPRGALAADVETEGRTAVGGKDLQEVHQLTG